MPTDIVSPGAGRRRPSDASRASDHNAMNQTSNLFLGARTFPWMTGGLPQEYQPRTQQNVALPPRIQTQLAGFRASLDNVNLSSQPIQTNFGASNSNVGVQSPSNHANSPVSGNDTVSQSLSNGAAANPPSHVVPSERRARVDSLNLPPQPSRAAATSPRERAHHEIPGWSSVPQGSNLASFLTNATSPSTEGPSSFFEPVRSQSNPSAATRRGPGRPPRNLNIGAEAQSTRPQSRSSAASSNTAIARHLQNHSAQKRPGVSLVRPLAKKPHAPQQNAAVPPQNAAMPVFFPQPWGNISLEQCSHFIQTWRPSHELNNDTKFRIDTLQKASKTGDVFYLMLHQTICRAILPVPTLPPFLASLSSLHEAAGILEAFLGRPSWDFINTFSNFPTPTMDYTAYPREAQSVKQFLGGGVYLLQRLEDQCKQRGYPPIAEELHLMMQIPSKIFSGVVFLAIFGRMMGMNEGHWLEGGLKFFQADLQQYEEHVARGISRTSEMQKAFALEYANLIKGALGHTTRSVSNTGSNPSRPASTSSHSGPTQVAPAQTNIVSAVPVTLNSTAHFFPRSGSFLGQVTPADPKTYALHHSHLRSPKLKTSNVEKSPNAPHRLFQYVAEFRVAPQQLPTTTGIQESTFHISKDDSAQIPTEETTEPWLRPTRHVMRGSNMYRLRCIKASTELDLGEWTTNDGYWPPNVYFKFNDHRLEQRKKTHHGKDLPIDITQYVRAGQNKVVVISNQSQNSATTQCFFAVELIRSKYYREIKEECEKRTIPTAKAKAALIKSLQNNPNSNSNDDDEEISIVSHSISINLHDPFASRIFDIPARGVSCRHKDCFDLETFLQTRQSKSAGEPSDPDHWRCPICGGDARPVSLIVDGWLLEVRSELARRDQLDAKIIVVQVDGSWEVKAEPTKAAVTATHLDGETGGKVAATSLHMFSLV